MNTRPLIAVVTAVTLVILFARTSVPPIDIKVPPSFVALGDLHGGHFLSTAVAVSSDGHAVVGHSHSDAGHQAFRWTSGEGIVALGFTQACSVSNDGSSVAGFRTAEGRVEPVLWTPRTGPLPLLTAATPGWANGASSDGQTIVGALGSPGDGAGPGECAFKWTQASGMTVLQPPESSSLRSEANAISLDSSVIVGVVRNQSGDDEACLWNTDGRPVPLGTLPGHTMSAAHAVSADGSVVVGVSGDHHSRTAFRWTRANGMVSLGALSRKAGDSSALGVSADGLRVVGYSSTRSGWQAFVWDETRGMRSVHNALEREGDCPPALRGWRLDVATAISADGGTIVGFGKNARGQQEGWLARLSPATKAPDRRPSAVEDAIFSLLPGRYAFMLSHEDDGWLCH